MGGTGTRRTTLGGAAPRARPERRANRLSARDPWRPRSTSWWRAPPSGGRSATPTASRARAFERVVIDGEPHVLKVMHVDDDWIARSLGDLGCHQVTMWASGLLRRLPPVDRPRGRRRRPGLRAQRLGRGAAACATWAPTSCPRATTPVPGRAARRVRRPPGRPVGPPLGLDRHGRPARTRRSAGRSSARACWPARPSGAGPTRSRSSPTRGWRAFADRAPADVRDVVDGLRAEPGVLVDAAGRHAVDVPARRLEDGQPRQPPRRPHDPARLRLPRGRARPATTSAGTWP